MKYLAALFVAFVLAVSLPVAAGEMCTVVRVVDGDTIKAWDADGVGLTVRLVGVDAPENHYDDKAFRSARAWRIPVGEVVAAGAEAAAFVRELLPRGAAVEIEAAGRGVDDYGRVLAYVYGPDGGCVNDALLREGYAQAYRREDFSRRGEFLLLEDEARNGKRGFWGNIWRAVE